MPDEFLVVDGVRVAGRWASRDVQLQGTLVLQRSAAIVRGQSGPLIAAAYGALTDATWRSAVLTLHQGQDAIDIRGGERLDHAWARIVQQACALPEMARGLRSLGTRRGGNSALQRQFFGPLLLARRRLEEPESIEWRLKQFEAVAVRRRIEESLAAIAQERFPASPPHRRALDAELGEAAEILLEQLAVLDRAAGDVLNCAEGRRFAAWREWSALLRVVFVEADRAWIRVLAALDAA